MRTCAWSNTRYLQPQGPHGAATTNEAPWGASALADVIWKHCDAMAPYPKNTRSRQNDPINATRVWAGYGWAWPFIGF